MIVLRLFILGCAAIVLVLAQEPIGIGKTEFIVTGPSVTGKLVSTENMVGAFY